MKVKLKHILRKGDVLSLIGAVAGETVVIEDVTGSVLCGNAGADPAGRYAVEHDGETLCYVKGGDKAAVVASLLSHLANLECEKKSLGRETLEKYKEISLFYAITEKMAAGLPGDEIARLMIDEGHKLVKNADHITVLIANSESGRLETLAESDQDFCTQNGFSPGEGLAGDILRSGRGEIVSDVRADPRCGQELPGIRSLMCAPLKVKDKVIGVIKIVSRKPAGYAAEDLKLVSALAFQAAVAIENTKLVFVRETFGRFLSDAVVKRLVESQGALKLGGEKITITIMMSDLRGFTSFSEVFPPESVVAVLNNYLKAMIDIIQKFNGTILEFIGDAIMVIFGAPLQVDNHASLAIACAIEMQLAMQRVNEWNIKNGYPEIEMGIGLNTGQVIVGNIGSEKRTKYGCVGSQVNLTSRIESFTVGGQILASAATVQTSRVEVLVRERNEIHPKGIKSPLTIFEVEGLGKPYNLSLPRDSVQLFDLDEELPVQLTLIEDKHYIGESFAGRLDKISLKEACLSTGAVIPRFTALKMDIMSSEGVALIEEIYVKVVTELDDHSYFVRFTSMPQAGRQYLSALLKRSTALLQ